MEYDIGKMKEQDKAFASYRTTRDEKEVLRILSWDILEVEPVQPENVALKNAEKVLKEEALKAQRDISEDLIFNEIRQGLTNPEDIANREASNIERSVLSSANAGVIAASQSLLREQENCVNPILKIKLEMKTALYSDYRAAINLAIKEPANKVKGIIVNKILTLSKTQASAIKALEADGQTKIYIVTFESNSFTDFDLNPDTHALHVSARVRPERADPKIIKFGFNVRDTILGGHEKSLKQRGDLKDVQSDAASLLSGKIRDFKTKVRKSKSVKKIEKYIKQKALSIERGDVKIQAFTDDVEGEKSKIAAGKNRAIIGNGLAALKFSKWYKNTSRKVQEATTPFAIDYKGWKPNILGKWFGSDNVTKVPTWKRNLGIAGDELIKLATAVTALKAFELAIEQSGIGNRLKDFNQEQAGRNINRQGTFADTGRGTNFNGNEIRSDIDRFIGDF